jgi:hypothetical protein
MEIIKKARVLGGEETGGIPVGWVVLCTTADENNDEVNCCLGCFDSQASANNFISKVMFGFATICRILPVTDPDEFLTFLSSEGDSFARH